VISLSRMRLWRINSSHRCTGRQGEGIFPSSSRMKGE
jgi:hypothetical protein